MRANTPERDDISMELPQLLRSSEAELQEALERDPELTATVSRNARVILQRTREGGYLADLRVDGATVVLVRADEHHRLLQRLKEQIANHVARDDRPDLT
ncbi:MAG: hypothetical protein WD737_00035 [Gemmatimonadota bacterium]